MQGKVTKQLYEDFMKRDRTEILDLIRLMKESIQSRLEQPDVNLPRSQSGIFDI